MLKAKKVQGWVVCALLNLTACAFAQSYNVSRLAVGNTRFRPERFGPAGQIAGRANVGNGLQQAAVWDQGQILILDVPSSRAYDINSQGQVVGQTPFQQVYQQATLWSPGQQLLGAWADCRNSEARAINEAGTIVGSSWDGADLGGHATR